MATSAVFEVSANQIVLKALRLVGEIDANQPASNTDVNDALESLNFMVKAMQSQGLHLWRKTEGIVPLNVGQTDYELGPTGDEIGNFDDTIFTELATDAVATDTVLTLETTSGMTGADDVLPFDPTDSLQGWTIINGTLSTDGNILTVANDAGNAGEVVRTFEDLVPGRVYQVNSDFILSTSPSVTYAVVDDSTTLASETLTASGTSRLQFTAPDVEVQFFILNGDAVGTNDTQTSQIQLLDTTTGDFIGTRLDDGTRQWEKIIEVQSAVDVLITNGLTGAASTGNSVVTFPELIDRPLRILQLRRFTIGENDEIETIQWSRQEYFAQPDKKSQGTINNWYYSPQLNNGRLYIWQTAADVDQVALFTYIRPIQVTLSTADKPDFPSEWYLPLSFSLATVIGPEYRIPQDRLDRLKIDAEEMMENALGYDREPDSLNIQPDFQGRA